MVPLVSVSSEKLRFICNASYATSHGSQITASWQLLGCSTHSSSSRAAHLKGLPTGGPTSDAHLQLSFTSRNAPGGILRIVCAAKQRGSPSVGTSANHVRPAAQVQDLEREEEKNDATFVPGNEFVITQQQPNTKGTSQFVRSLAEMYPRLPCRICRGVEHVPCERCEGKGSLARGGYQKRNPVNLERIVGSKWTAMERTFGWRHFRVHSKRKGSGKEWFVEMVATCDETSRFWVNAQNLKDRERWSMGWLQKVEIEAAQGALTGGSLKCKACKGACVVRCQACDKRTAGNDGEEEGSLEIIEV